MLQLLLVLAAFFILIALAWLLALKLNLLKPTAKETLPYRACPALLTPAERAFFTQLQAALPILTATLGKPTPPLLFAKVRLADLIEVDPDRVRSNNSARQTARNRIDRKHADFVLCAPHDTRPILIIELNDKSHDRPDRIQRDQFLTDACEAAALPILPIRAASTYNPQSLAHDIAAALHLPTPTAH